MGESRFSIVTELMECVYVCVYMLCACVHVYYITYNTCVCMHVCSRNLLECLTTAVQLIHQWLAVNGKSKNLVVPQD